MTRYLALLFLAATAALPASALSFNPFVPLFERLSFVTDFFGFLFLIARNWIVFVLEAIPGLFT